MTRVNLRRHCFREEEDHDAGFVGGAEGIEHRPDIDWEAVERSPEFRELTKRKKAFVVPATAFFMAWYFGFVIPCGYAPDFMGREFITDGLTVGYALALSQFVMTGARLDVPAEGRQGVRSARRRARERSRGPGIDSPEQSLQARSDHR